MTITFADISHHQTTVDLAAYAAAGHDRVFLKATQGRTGTDATFAARWKAAGALGLARGPYHFAESEDDGAADFDHFIAVVNAAGGLGPRDLLCLDSEDSPDMARADEHAREFTARAVERGHSNGCLYTGRWFADPANLRPDDLAPGWRRLWISDYGTTADGAIRLPAGWTRDQVIARQYSSTATVAGIAGPCDASRVLNDWISDMAVTDGDAGTIWDHEITNPVSGVKQPAWRRLLDANDDSAVAALTARLDAQATRLGSIEGTLAEVKTALAQMQISGGSLDVAALVKAINDDAAKRMES